MSIKKLPDAEFEIMKTVWHMEPPITSALLTEKLRLLLPQKNWKPQTVLTMLVRLEKKGFLTSVKNGKERQYSPAVSEAEYLQIEADSLRRRFHGSALNGFVKTLCADKDFSQKDIEDLRQWLDSREK